MATLAAAQYGVITAAQLRRCGVASSTVGRWVQRGRLQRLYRGVYAFGHASLVANGRRLAAVLACGPGAVLSHRAAAQAWGLRPDNRPRFDVTVPGWTGGKIAAIDRHRSTLHPRDHTLLDGVPITTVARTLLDLAAVEPAAQVARAVERAEELRLLDLRAIDDVIGRAPPRRRGLKRLRTALAAYRPDAHFVRSNFERRTVRLIARAGLPRPLVNTLVAGYEVDLHWPEHHLIVELDTYDTHGSPHAFERDRARDQALTIAGYRVVRLTSTQLDHDPKAVIAALARLGLAAELRSPAGRASEGGTVFNAGDRVVAESESTERAPRQGEVQEVLRGDPHPRYRIRWDDGHESIYTPADGALHAAAGT